MLIATEQAAVFLYCLLQSTSSVMETSIKTIQEIASVEALATALGHVVLQLFTTRINALVALIAFISLVNYLLSGHHPVMAALAVIAWVLHLAVMMTISIAKGGDRL